ncbi:unnamed protein product [Macrosiphum euphorbiae]|uniref:Uncharacterized protein n=1 Tax=Macrosiphum euphorbiae TaxID=13131 RepID=A0AAV0X900_9HEMI|nr:unnamed protein product [Macrosiphum euphorbiae]
MSFKPEHEQSLDIENCLGLMTDNDLDKFFNLYKIITSLDPNANALIKKASMDELLSGKLIDKEHLKELCVAKVEESEQSNKEDIDVSSNDHTFFDVYDHIESWKKRMHPMMNKIEDLVEELKTISQRTSSADILKVSNLMKEQTIKNSNDDVVSNSNRYLSNIDKYIEISESHNLISEVFHQSPAGHDGIKISETNLDSESDKLNIHDEIGNAKENILPLIDEEKTQKTLLVPTNAYLETENQTNVDEFEVNTYYFER